MTSHTTRRFWDLYYALPSDMQHQADKAYERFRQDPFHSGLVFKEVNKSRGIWSARINNDYRVLGARSGQEITWFWIGSHSQYDRLLSQMG